MVKNHHNQELSNYKDDALSTTPLRFGSFVFDPVGHTLLSEAGREIVLTRAEFALLNAFLRSPGRVLSRDFLLTAIAGRDAKPYDRTIDVLIGRLRRKLGSPQVIVTVSGAGYKFALRPQAVDAPAPPSSPIPHRTERRQVTVLSCQLPGLTALADQIDPNALAALAADFRQHCMAVIDRFGGLVTHPSPDGLVAQFGYPQASEFSAVSTVRAALALTETSAHAPDLSPGPPSIGIASGQVVFGTFVGTSADVIPETIGGPIRLAAKLCDLAGPGETIIAESTRMLVANAFELLPASPDQSAWKITGVRRAPSNRPGRRQSRLVGRRRPLAAVLEHWRATQSGTGRVIVLSGEAGIGKSRLCASLAERVEAEGHRTLRAYCAYQHKTTFLHPFAMWLAEAARCGRAESGKQLVERLAALLAAHHLPAVEMLLAGLLDPAAEHSNPVLSPAQRRRQIGTVLLDLIQALGGDAPFLFVFEDLQWADEASLEILDLLIERSWRMPVLAVLTIRSDVQSPWANLPNVATVELGPLKARAAAAMVADLDDGRRLDSATVGVIVERAGGLPLFLEELTKATLGTTPATATIPATLEDSLRSRIDRLGQARDLVQSASVIGRVFRSGDLSALTDVGEPALGVALASLVAAEILEPSTFRGESAFVFRHELMRVAVYQWLPPADRRLLHGRLARTLAARLDAEPQELAYHFEEADEFAESITYRLAAARRTARHGPASAIGHLVEAQRVLDRMPPTRARDGIELDVLLVLLEQQVALFGALSLQARATWTRTLELGERLQRHTELVRGLNARFLSQWTASQLKDAEHTAELMLKSAHRADSPRATIIAHRACGMTAFSKGDFSLATSHYEEAYRLWRPRVTATVEDSITSDPNSVLTVSGLAYALTITGHPKRGLDVTLDVVRLARGVDQPHFRVVALATECHLRHLRSEPQALAQAAAELAALATRFGATMWACLVKVFDGYARVLDTRSPSYLAPMQEAIAEYGGSGRLQHVPYYLGLTAEASYIAGQRETAEAALVEALAVAERAGERWYLAELWRIRGDVAGSLDERKSAYERASAIARQQGATLWHDRARQRAATLTR